MCLFQKLLKQYLLFHCNIANNNYQQHSIVLSGKYCQKRLDHAKKYATEAFETASKRVNQKTAEATGDLITNKIANKITKDYKNSEQSNSETVTNEKDKEIPKKKIYIFRKKTRNH